MITTIATTMGMFNMDNISILQSLGYEVHVACNFNNNDYWPVEVNQKFKEKLNTLGIIVHQVDFSRNAAALQEHRKAYHQLFEIMRKYDFSFIHTHTPIASVLSRKAASRQHIRSIYTCHGYNFFHGGPIIDWLIFYPLEKHYSRKTDIIININENDYQISVNHFHAKKVIKIPGVGIDYARFSKDESDEEKINFKRELMNSLQLDPSMHIVLSVGELNKNKNHQVMIHALSRMRHKDVCYLICGQGNERDNLIKLAESLGVSNRFRLLGYRNDTDRISRISDLFVFPSLREGLGLAAVEAMAAGLPLITSNRGGINDYSKEGTTGYLLNPDDWKGFAEKADYLLDHPDISKTIGNNNRLAAQKYDRSVTHEIMKKVYTEI